MQLRFVKGAGKHDTLEVIDVGQATQRIDCPRQGIIPHDMVHYAVESTLRTRGFLGRVLAGESASFRMAAEAESDGVERLVEVLQADGWSGWGAAADDLLQLYQHTCSARRCPPLAIRAQDIQAVRERVLDLSAQWQSLAVGESLDLRMEHDPTLP